MPVGEDLISVNSTKNINWHLFTIVKIGDIIIISLLLQSVVSDISKGCQLKSLRRLAHLRRCFPAINHSSVISNSSKTESCSFPRTSLWDVDVVARY